MFIRKYDEDVKSQSQEERVHKWLEKSCYHHFLGLSDRNYPEILKNIPDPPEFLYVIGNLENLKGKCCSIVGSRNPSKESKDNTRKISEKLAFNNIILVSGLALGIDSIVHESALKVGGKTIAVMPCGVDVIYPQFNAQLYSKIIENNTIISEYPLGSTPKKHHFIRRNRIVTGLSNCTIIIEAKLKSGTISSAYHALNQNREVLTIPIGFDEEFAQGNLKLIEEGATCLTSIDDALSKVCGHSHTMFFEDFEDFCDFCQTSPDRALIKLSDLISKGLCFHKSFGFVLVFLTES